MPYSERAYFEGDHCQHCADRNEHLRQARISKTTAQHIRQAARQMARERRTGSRAA